MSAINKSIDTSIMYSEPTSRDAIIKILIKHTDEGNLIELEKLRSLKHEWNVLDEKDNSLLHIATEKGYKRVVEFLLSIKEVNPKLLNKEGLSAFHIAARDGHNEIVTLLLKHLNVDIRSRDGATPLIMAAWKGHASTVKLLLENKADSRLTSEEGYTPLHNACCSKNKAAVLELLMTGNIEINYQAKSGATALMIAANNGCDDIVKLLLQYGANLHLLDLKGSTAAIHATRLGYKSTASILKKESLELREHSREYFFRKLLGHVFQISGYTKLLSPPQLLSRTPFFVDLEGLDSNIAWLKIAKYTTNYLQTLPSKPCKDWDIIAYLFTEGTTPHSTPEHLLHNYKSKKPVIVSTGFKEHAALAIIWNEHLTLCETGGFLKKIIGIYHINQSTIDAPFIEKLQKLRRKTEDEFIHFWATKIPLAASTEKDKLAGLQPYLDFPKQRGGHCSVISIHAVVFGLLSLVKAHKRLNQSKPSISDEALKRVRNESLKEFSSWLKYIQSNVLEKYKTKTSLLYTKDTLLIEKCEKLLSATHKDA